MSFAPSSRVKLTPRSALHFQGETLFDRIGYFDESYFAFFEDVDLGIRAQLAGFRCWYEPRAVVRHRFSTTAGRAPERKMFLLVRNGLVAANPHLHAEMLAAIAAAPPLPSP